VDHYRQKITKLHSGGPGGAGQVEVGPLRGGQGWKKTPVGHQEFSVGNEKMTRLAFKGGEKAYSMWGQVRTIMKTRYFWKNGLLL